MHIKKNSFALLCAAICPVATFLAGCTADSTSSVTVNGDVPIAYVKRPVAAIGNPTEAYTFSPGGDLYILDKSAPGATEVNVTTSYTQGNGDVSDPEVSYDADKLLFSMRGPSDPSWRVWEYDIAKKTLTQIPCTVASGTTPSGDDVDPAYLPDGRIVFVSNRQIGSQQHMTEQGQTPFAYLDEYERQRTTTLHVMNSDGTGCHQISANQSHDRNPTVMPTGEIMYSRWDHVGTRNQFTVFSSNPDGTSLFVLYGAHSGVTSFLHPRPMPNGQILSDAMPLSRTHEGGALMAIDVQNYSENCEPGPGVPAGCAGQHQVTEHTITTGRDISPYGRFSDPYPLWDGTNRALVLWTPSCLASQSVAKPFGDCQTVVNPLSGLPQASEDQSPPTYGAYMLDLSSKSMRPIVLPPPRFAIRDPIAIQKRPKPNILADKPLNATLAGMTSQVGTTGVGIFSVRSVYDTDSQGRMGDAVLVAGESIPKISGVADLAKLKDPAQTPADKRPARFIRVTRAVPTQAGISREAIGETDFEMQQILGYVPIEPDGSFKIQVPADMPLGLTAIDSSGRGFTHHTNWIQARPGETRSCNGCHSPRRGNSINVDPIAGNHPNTLLTAQTGETMAETRARLFSNSTTLNPDMVFTDIWTNPAAPAVVAAVNSGARTSLTDPDLIISYSGLTTPAPVNGVIDYPTHIAPLWDAHGCANCHNNPDPQNASSAGLDLRNNTGGTGRLTSYDELLIGDPVLDANGQPVLQVDGDQIRVQRHDAQVINGFSRQSHLIEVLFNQELNSDYALGSTNHSAMLNAAEKRLVSEWVDVGAQYYNSPRDSGGKLRGVTGLDQAVFVSTVQPILLNRCGVCHQAVGLTSPTSGVNTGFTALRFVLTGDQEGDYNVTLSMIGDVSNPDASELLSRPTSNNVSPNPTHPQVVPAGGGAAGPVFATTLDCDYQAIRRWITGTTGSCP